MHNSRKQEQEEHDSEFSIVGKKENNKSTRHA